MADSIKVLVVDDHALFRRGIIEVLACEQDIQVVGEAADGIQAVEKVESLAPHVVLMDLNMPRCDGLEASHTLLSKMPELNIIILTVSEKEADLFRAIRLGVRGYLLKDTDPTQLVAAVRDVSQGGAIVSPQLARGILDELKDVLLFRQLMSGESPQEIELTERETEILGHVADGATRRRIAELLSISENTVKTHLRNAMSKLRRGTGQEVATYIARRKATPPSQD